MIEQYSFPSLDEVTDEFFMAFAMTEYDAGGSFRFDPPEIASLKAHFHRWDANSEEAKPVNLRICTREELGLNATGQFAED